MWQSFPCVRGACWRHVEMQSRCCAYVTIVPALPSWFLCFLIRWRCIDRAHIIYNIVEARLSRCLPMLGRGVLINSHTSCSAGVRKHDILLRSPAHAVLSTMEDSSGTSYFWLIYFALAILMFTTMSQPNDERERTVSFNVGGQIFVVRRSLLDAFPSTMLARSASKEWGGEESATPIFIDRDSGQFRYCLDFMRDGKVWLPATESNAALLSDLTYFGFENIDPDAVNAQSTAMDASRYFDICHEYVKKGNHFLTTLLAELKRNRLDQANMLFKKLLPPGELCLFLNPQNNCNITGELLKRIFSTNA